MSPSQPTFFLNLHSNDAAAAAAFYQALGFALTNWSDDKTKSFRMPAPNDNILVFVHESARFREWIRPGTEPVDAHKSTECLLSVASPSREAVDEWLAKAVEAGGAKDPFTMEYGAKSGMYTRSFADLDGHIWEVCYSEPGKECGAA
jgi:uncharacterized protein